MLLDFKMVPKGGGFNRQLAGALVDYRANVEGSRNASTATLNYIDDLRLGMGNLIGYAPAEDEAKIREAHDTLRRAAESMHDKMERDLSAFDTFLLVCFGLTPETLAAYAEGRLG